MDGKSTPIDWFDNWLRSNEILEHKGTLEDKGFCKPANVKALTQERLLELLPAPKQQGDRDAIWKAVQSLLVSRNDNINNNNAGGQGWVFDPVAFRKLPLKYPTFEPNGDSIKMVGRKCQVKKLIEVVIQIGTKPKMEVVIICSTRGMGKTFFVKKICLLQHGPICAARLVGRIITIEGKAGCDYFLQDLKFSYFWPRVIVLNILEMFDGCTVAGIPFERKAEDTIYGWSVMRSDDISREGSLAQWAHMVVQGGISKAISELTRLTNIAFGVQDDSRPVFLLDNAHELAKRQLVEQVSTRDPSLCHTYLSKVLDNLTADRPICIVAGTTDGAIDLIAEYSNFVPVYIHLTPIGPEHWNEMGSNIVGYLNRDAQPHSNIVWPRLCIGGGGDAPIEDELAAPAIQGAPQIIPPLIIQESASNTPPPSRAKTSSSPGDVVMSEADLGSGAMVDDELTDKELMNIDGTQPASVFSEDASILVAMIYTTCQVPRMMYMAVQSWHWGKLQGLNPETITTTFETNVRNYYQASLIPNNFTPADFLLVMCTL